tara:strand:+ start:11072 stop:11359 length:288 start_codon:yes stop_codon:yes gene_type:complete
MGKVEDVTGEEINPGDFVTVQGWRGLEVAKVRTFTSSCMLCDYTYVHSDGQLIKSRLQPYLPNHKHTASNHKYPNRMLKVLKITEEQYERFQQNL